MKRRTRMRRKLYEMEAHEKRCYIVISELLKLEDIEEPPTG